MARRTATQQFVEGCRIEKVLHPPRELVLHLEGGRVLRVRAYVDLNEGYGLDFVFEKDGQRVDGQLRPIGG
jgi:hypothetical protein